MRNWILRDLGDDQLIEAVERNTLDHLVFLPSRHPSMDVLTKEDAVFIDSKYPSSLLNFAFAMKSSKEDFAKKHEEAVSFFKEKQRPFSMIVSPCSSTQSIKAESSIYLKEIDVYVLNLHLFKKKLKYIPAFRVQQALTKVTFGDVAKLYEIAYEGKGHFMGYFDKISSLAFHSLDPIKFFVGYLNDRAMIAGELYLGAGIAGVKVTLHPEAFSQAKEFFVDLTTKMLLQAQEHGYYFAKASPFFEKHDFYEDLGFKKYCKFLKFEA